MNQVRGSHPKALKAEWIKLKRTGLIWMCLAAAAFIPLILTIVYFFVDLPANERINSFTQEFIEQCFKGFTSFFFPLFLILVVTRIVYIEHRSDTWKLLETQPVTRFSIFIAKWEIAILMSLICLILLFALSYLGSFLVFQIKAKKLVDKDEVEWSQLLQFLSRLWISSLGLISLQYLLALLIRNFVWPVIIGLISLIAGSIFIGFDLFNWFPYSATALTSSFAKGSSTGSYLIPHEMLSILWSLLFLFLAHQLFLRKKFFRAFIHPSKRLIVTIGVLLGFGFLFWYINRPTVLPSYGKTVFAGVIQSDKPVSKIILFKLPTFDTLSIVPVTNGKFHTILSTEPSDEIYIVQAGRDQTQVYFGKGDSVYLDWNVKKDNRKRPRITGTRIAENAFLAEGRGNSGLNYLGESADWFNSTQFSSQILSEWTRGQDRIEKFRTVDNIKPAADFIQLQKKLLAVDLLTLTEITYPRSFAIHHPNDTLKYSPRLKQLQENVSFSEETLVPYRSYRQYVSAVIQKKALKRNQPFISLLDKEVPSEKLRDYLALDAAQKNLASIRDSAKRWAMLQWILPIISEEKLRVSLLEQNDRLNKLQRGRKAPDFVAESVSGSDMRLEELANRYLVIDVWATWCAPCKEQDPYFEQLAEQYTSDRVAFISISVDQDKDAWRGQVHQKSKKVLQLWAKNGGAEFMKDYSVGSIPRFMLIDPKGYILNVQLPHPSEAQFELELEKDIPSLRPNFVFSF